MLQQPIADDYLICSGASVSLRSIILHAFNRFKISEDRLLIKENLFRPTEIIDNYGIADKAKKQLNWVYDADFYTILDLLIDEELKNWKK